MRGKDLLGQIFNNLKIIEGPFSSKSGRGWRCLCLICGQTFITKSHFITTGKRKGCGCARGLPKDEGSFRTLMKHYIHNAKIKHLEFTLTEAAFRQLTKSNCFYCNIEPQYLASTNSACYRKERYIYNGVDRIDNTKGYTNENVVSCCRKCNWMKGKLSQEEFLNHIGKVYEWKSNCTKFITRN